ncbi:MAG: hypothetical protein EZS28_029736 [Streblomastix strix]|uniref:Uncharacterized protein n=1 Tax=Streblomastix strix TaxID=222440 RepID=A0A5J4UWS1_9EUKA|nr:MAG: hypothetical protein EZS28_029736 [Streblomastix strix]
MNGVILEAIYTSLGSAIHVNASEKSSIEAELVVFKEIVSDVSLKGKGGAIYMNITQFEVKISFTRLSQESLIGCRAVTGITDEQDISFCFEIMNETDQYINE